MPYRIADRGQSDISGGTFNDVGRDQHNQTDSHDRTDSHNITDSHNKTDSHNATDSHNRATTRNHKGSRNYKESYSYDTEDSDDVETLASQIMSHLPSGMSQLALMNNMKRQKAALIAVMGATGSGKSTFINKACDAGMAVGNDLESCTQSIEVSKSFTMGGRTVYMIDTPGFDDTNKSDADVLKEIALYLAESYKNGIQLSGVLYLHRITDNRVSGVTRRNMMMFQQLCGFNAMSNVIIVTTMWQKLENQDEGARREQQLGAKSIFLKQALEGGAQLIRHPQNTKESARAVISKLLAKDPVTLQIQKEMVDEKKTLTESAAGSYLNNELREQIKKHEEELKNLREEMAATRHQDTLLQEELEEEARTLRESLNKAREEKEKIATDYANMREEAEKRGGC
ncbi:hypothetical protein E1B28_008423 [Marasmius oreades]|uniref:AIG1-type G domain-containing protein n=1 Tax=Marasmius oreades TaxID=181124 RepID=A0A9P7URR5_9AGAR|nr:uncharacterized protein E1B28_008423 [Marasmius oreades]KAG7092042.1 hypothetical protein E1B28_008423 [Marasmius oreades]